MKFYTVLFAFSLFSFPFLCNGQASNPNAHCENKKFDKKVKQLLSFTIPVIDVDELKAEQDSVYIFDAREPEEYKTSHIKGAKYIGYNDFDPTRLGDLPKDAKIVVYCSVGYRSEKVGNKLKELGYENVQNLYGSLFEWVNRGYPVVDDNNKETNEVHTYNKKWSQWVDENKAKKTW